MAIKKFLIIFSSLCLSVLAGCSNLKSQVPIATTYEYSTQQKMQAAHHWDVLAEDVAKRLKDHLSTFLIGNREITVVSDQSTPFDKAFQQLLITQLVNQGLNITDNANSELKLSYSTQVIRHEDRGYIRPRNWTFTKLAVLGNGLWGLVSAASNTSEALRDALIVGSSIGAGLYLDARSGDIASITNKEVIINVSLKEDDKYLMRKSGIYYINDTAGYQYDKDDPLTRKFHAVSG